MSRTDVDQLNEKADDALAELYKVFIEMRDNDYYIDLCQLMNRTIDMVSEDRQFILDSICEEAEYETSH